MAASGPGQELFVKNCAFCHDHPGPGVKMPTTDSLRKMSSKAILKALQTGVMKSQASGLTSPQKKAIADYLGGKSPRAAVSTDSGRIGTGVQSAE